MGECDDRKGLGEGSAVEGCAGAGVGAGVVGLRCGGAEGGDHKGGETRGGGAQGAVEHVGAWRDMWMVRDTGGVGEVGPTGVTGGAVGMNQRVYAYRIRRAGMSYP